MAQPRLLSTSSSVNGIKRLPRSAVVPRSAANGEAKKGAVGGPLAGWLTASRKAQGRRVPSRRDVLCICGTALSGTAIARADDRPTPRPYTGRAGVDFPAPGRAGDYE